MERRLAPPPRRRHRRSQRRRNHQCKEVLSRMSRIFIFVFLSICSSSNFKRQNTIDSAQIKENTARLATQRPISAQPKTIDSEHPMQAFAATKFDFHSIAASSTSPAKPRTTMNKFDVASSGNRTVGLIPRRSTTLYEKTSSTEKTNASTDST